MLKTTAAILVIGSALTATQGVAAKERCFYRQQQVCTYGEGHGSRLVCTNRKVRQCFQVPELHSDKTRVPRFRRRR